ncbi:MAG: ABC transporter permease, partial [Acidobacteria bacterium]|nr:ABC transporter permease [Acidobacteriota bacterium]
MREIIREAVYSLYHHRFRAALSMLGISWGIISVVVLLAYGNGFRGALDAGFRGAFSDGTVISFPGQTSLQAGGERAGKRVRVT